MSEPTPMPTYWELAEEVTHLHGQLDKLQAENAELRELASILRYCMQVNADCDGCKLNGAKGEFVHDPLLACDGLHDRMRELGVDA